MKTLIGLTGKKRSGKDTAGAMLSEITGFETYSFAGPLKEICGEIFDLDERHEDGDLKEVQGKFIAYDWRTKIVGLCRGHFDELIEDRSDDEIIRKFYMTILYPNLLSENEATDCATVDCSPRVIYQKFGTEFARSLRSTIWVDLADNKYQEKGSLIVTDVRFDNEAEWIKSSGGVLVEMRRSEADTVSDGHASEAGVSKLFIDQSIRNNFDSSNTEEEKKESFEELRNSVEVLCDYYLNPLSTLAL